MRVSGTHSKGQDGTVRVLGLETSCDETAAAVLACRMDGEVPDGKILSNVVLSQFEAHAAYGGVVPEIAARAHVSALDGIIQSSLDEAGLGLADIDLVAATAGPGLIGGVMVGLMTAKALSASRDIPMVAVNHLEGHALTARLTDQLSYPYLLMLLSGGHSQIILVEGFGQYRRWATTIDDALGEAFDKTAKLLSLTAPGGPNVEKAALAGDPKRFAFPMPLKGQDTLNFSFSGLKTAVRQQAKKLEPVSDMDVADICASFQDTVAATLANRAERAIAQFTEQFPGLVNCNLVVAGGVAANQVIRTRLDETCAQAGWNMVAPPLSLCTDNGAMIAWAGFEHYVHGSLSGLDVSPRPRWPLDETVAGLLGHGKKGTKA